jgi:broad specificity phosphatase PhoE
MPVLYFVRHGETDWNAEGRLQGVRDVPLNPLGRAQAEEVAVKLRGLPVRPEGLDFVTSPLTRTRQTMEILRRTLGLEPGAYRVDDRLRELSFGDWEGLTWREVRTRHAQDYAARERDKWGYVPRDGESYALGAARAVPAVRELSRDSLVVSHGGIARARSAACRASRRPGSTSGRGESWSSRTGGTAGSDATGAGRALPLRRSFARIFRSKPPVRPSSVQALR